MRLAVAVPLLCAACSFEPEAPVVEWTLSERTREVDPQTGEPYVPLEVQARIAAALEQLFGTVRAPRFFVPEDWKAEGFDPNRPPELAAESGRYPTLAESAERYRVQCLHCHGASGGGDGPTARFLDPLPRDYRKGIFKFTALREKAMPRRADLLRVLEEGVAGTAMPSFARFSRAELEGLVNYVRLLSLRGMVESDLALTYENDGELPEDYPLEAYLAVWERWEKAREKLIVFDGEVPPPTSERLARGAALFRDATKGNCASCHGPDGRGNGPSVWMTDERGRMIPALKDEWGHPSLPRDLTRGTFRGGKRPIDVYRRIWAGINGTPMPGLGESRDASGELLLSAEDLWSLVHFARSLSTPAAARGM